LPLGLIYFPKEVNFMALKKDEIFLIIEVVRGTDIESSETVKTLREIAEKEIDTITVEKGNFSEDFKRST